MEEEEVLELAEEMAQEVAESLVNYGYWSLAPIAVIFLLSIITKRTLFAMFMGMLTGVIVKIKGDISLFMETFTGSFYRALGDETFQWVILIVAGIGILIVLFERSNAVKDLGAWMSKFLKKPKHILAGTFLFGLIVFLDDYLSNLAVGNTMKSITDNYKIPRSQLAYIALVMSGPISLLIPLSSWTVAYIGIYEKVGIVGADGTGFMPFIHSIPLMFYAWVAIAVLLLQIFGVIPKFGRIKKDYEKAEKTGNTFPASWKKDYSPSPESDPQISLLKTKPNPLNFLLPMIITIFVTFYADIDISAGVFAGIISAFVLYLLERRLSLWQLLDATLDGIVKMGFVIVLFVLAYSVTGLNNDLGMPAYVIGAVEPFMKGAFLPLVAFIFCAIYGYFTGACWDLAMIIVPIVAPLAQLVGVDPLLACSAVFSGALYGNVLCPYGDGVILSAQSCDIRPTDIMFSIAPYMLIAGAITAIMYLGAGFIF